MTIFLRPNQSRKKTCYEGRDHAAAEHRCDDRGGLADCKVDGLAQIKESGGDDGPHRSRIRAHPDPRYTVDIGCRTLGWSEAGSLDSWFLSETVGFLDAVASPRDPVLMFLPGWLQCNETKETGKRPRISHECPEAALHPAYLCQNVNRQLQIGLKVTLTFNAAMAQMISEESLCIFLP